MDSRGCSCLEIVQEEQYVGVEEEEEMEEGGKPQGIRCEDKEHGSQKG